MHCITQTFGFCLGSSTLPYFYDLLPAIRDISLALDRSTWLEPWRFRLPQQILVQHRLPTRPGLQHPRCQMSTGWKVCSVVAPVFEQDTRLLAPVTDIPEDYVASTPNPATGHDSQASPRPVEKELHLLPRVRDKRVKNAIPKKLKGKTNPKSGAFGVMTVSFRADAPAASRNAAAKRTSESTVMAARLAANPPAPLPRRRVPILPAPYPHSRQRQHPLTPAETKSEQVRLLALLRSLHPVRVVDQLCRALAFFGGVPGASSPSLEHSFPPSVAANGSGSLFVGWLSEIFPQLGPSTPALLSSIAPKRVRGRPRGSKTIRMRSSLIANNTRNEPARPQPSTHAVMNTDGGDDGWVDVEEPLLNDLVPRGAAEGTEVCEQPADTSAVPVSGANPEMPPSHEPQQPSDEPRQPNEGPQPSKRRRGRPKGSKNRPKGSAGPAFEPYNSSTELISPLPRKGRGRPKGSKNKPKDRSTTGSRKGHQKAGQLWEVVGAADPVRRASVDLSSEAPGGLPVTLAQDESPGQYDHDRSQDIQLDVTARPRSPPDASAGLVMMSTSGNGPGTVAEPAGVAPRARLLAPAMAKRIASLGTESSMAVNDGPPAKRQKTAAGRAQHRLRQQQQQETQPGDETPGTLHQQAQVSHSVVSNERREDGAAEARSVQAQLPSTSPSRSQLLTRTVASREGGDPGSLVAQKGRGTTLMPGRSARSSKQMHFQQPASNVAGRVSIIAGTAGLGGPHHLHYVSLPHHQHRPDQHDQREHRQSRPVQSRRLTSTNTSSGPAQVSRALQGPAAVTPQGPPASGGNEQPPFNRTATSMPSSHGTGYHLVAPTDSTSQPAAPPMHRSYAQGSEMVMLNDFPNPNLLGFGQTADSRHGHGAAGSTFPPDSRGLQQGVSFHFGGTATRTFDAGSTNAGIRDHEN